MNKIIKLINDEKRESSINSAKACWSDSCSKVDNATCGTMVIDTCDTDNGSSCTQEDICGIDGT